MPENILSAGSGIGKSTLEKITATENDIRSGMISLDSEGNLITGNIPDKGAWSGSVNPGSTIKIPSGIHNGGGSVKGKSLKGSGTTGNLDINHDNWVNGHKARARSNVTWTISGKTLTLKVLVSSWLEGNESGGGSSNTFNRSFTVPVE